MDKTNLYICKVCGKKVHAIYVRTLASFIRRQLSKAEDGDWPGEITVDHWYNVETTVNLFKAEEHKHGLIFGKPCPGSGFMWKRTATKRVGRPYILHKSRSKRDKSRVGSSGRHK